MAAERGVALLNRYGSPMSGWIKICGMTSPDAVTAAIDAGVDAIGFVFATSVRRVTPERAAELARGTRQRVTCVAVTLHPSQEEINEIERGFHPDLLQTDIGDYATLKIPRRLMRLPVLRSTHAPLSEYPPRLLYEGARSGSGEVSDWTVAAAIARRTKLILAGGLTAANVGDAIRAVRPYGVDTSSGVESRPGVKSAQRIVKFVLAARAAFSEIAA
jgi:phosphoribosylanthranilate isomerase